VALASLTPDGVADEVVQAVLRHLDHYAVPLSPGITLTVEGDREGRLATTLALSASDLTRYAQTGDTGDWGGDDGAAGVIHEVAEACYSSPAGWAETDLAREVEPTTAIGTVLIAAEARRRLAAGEAIPRLWLAVLLGVGERYVRKLVAAGEVRTAGQPTDRRRLLLPASVRRYLRARVVGDDDARVLDRAAPTALWQTGPEGERLLVSGGLEVATLATARGWDRCGRAWVARR
jgi:hypothetical protein